jgi:homoserine dehydrogenase
MSAKIKIGLFGFGCVGQGLYDVLEATPSLKAEIKSAVYLPNVSRLTRKRF